MSSRSIAFFPPTVDVALEALSFFRCMRASGRAHRFSNGPGIVADPHVILIATYDIPMPVADQPDRLLARSGQRPCEFAFRLDFDRDHVLSFDHLDFSWTMLRIPKPGAAADPRVGDLVQADSH
jgi:hypothetical protein